MKKGKNSLLPLMVLLLLSVNATLGVLLTRQSSQALISLIQSRMLDISNTAAAMLDGDSLSRLTADDADTKEYQKVMETLTYFQDNIDLKYIYCIQDMGDGTFAFSVDPTVADPGEFGSPIVFTDALYRASLGVPSVDSQPYEDAWGAFYSAYSPVFTSSGDVGGIVAVDFSADWYDRQVSHLIATVIYMSALSLLVGVLIVSIIARRNRQRYRVLYGQLTALAVKVEELAREMEAEGPLSASEKETILHSIEGTRQVEDIDALGAKILSMQDEIRGHIERIRKQAYLDSLTGVGNKAAYLETVSRLGKLIRKEAANFAVGVFDMNGLKTINDNYGHECGDMALTDAATALKAAFGKENLYRIGGDEFIAIIARSDENEMPARFQRLEDELAEVNRKERPYALPLALSKGVAVYVPGQDADFQAVFKRADLAMYEDKRAYYAKHGDRRRKAQ
ncbi:MAG: diguanylate cyclase [Oscillospiraceae bacterium]|nr:diguanylate cyclase [Oscillospiraceae bacterium]